MTTSRTPELEELISRAIEYYLNDLYTTMPGRIESYDSATQMADVKIVLQRRIVNDDDGTEELEELPIIPNVPVVFLRGGGAFVSVPVKRGDQVMVHFSQGSLDNWLSGSGDVTDPDDVRCHDITDAIAVPGLYPFTSPIRDISDSGLRIGFDRGGAQITITDSGTMEVSIDGVSDEAVMLGNAFQLWWNSMIQPWLITHTHSTPFGPTSPPIAPLPPFDPNIISRVLKLKGF